MTNTTSTPGTNTDTMTAELTDDLVQDLIDRHLEAYGQPDADLRDPVVAAIWNETGRLVDPPIDGTGHEGISGLAAVVAQHYPGHRFVRTTAIDRHHEFARYGWSLCDATGAEVITGLDVVTVGPDGRLLQVVGFFGPLAAR